MNPLSLPVLGGAAVVSSLALWRALVEGTIAVEVALGRYLVSVVVCWVALALAAMLVGPAPVAVDEELSEEDTDAVGVS